MKSLSTLAAKLGGVGVDNLFSSFSERVYYSLKQLENWVEKHDYKAYEPFDGLSSPFRRLTLGSLLLDRLLMQAVRQCPWNLRPLLKIKPLESTKGRGYMARGYLAMFAFTRDPVYEAKARRCLDWLIINKSPKYDDFSWANHFDFASRGGRYEKHESILVWTALVGHAFVDGYETLQDPRYLDVATSACQWILKLPRENTRRGSCISYYMIKQSSIHNANLLGASLLARCGKIRDDREFVNVATDAVEYSCSRQHQNGSWWYAEDRKYHWIDNFHTGYNLVSLKIYRDYTGNTSYDECLRKGFRYYIQHFFRKDGRPRYYHNRTYPIDSQCAAQSIETLCLLRDYHDAAPSMAIKVADFWIREMQDPSGYFYFRKYPFLKAKAPMLHWSQAVTYWALVLLWLNLQRFFQSPGVN